MQDIQSTQLDLVGSDVVVLTIVCASPASASNVYGSARECLLGEGLTIGPYDLKCGPVEQDSEAAPKPAMPIVDATPDEDAVLVCWPLTGRIQVLRSCPEDGLGIAAGSRRKLAHVVAALADAVDGDLYVPGFRADTSVGDAERAVRRFSGLVEARMRPAVL